MMTVTAGKGWVRMRMVALTINAVDAAGRAVMSEEKKYVSDESKSAPDWFLKCIEPAQASAAPEQAKMCDCNQGRLPCSCKQVSAVPEQEPVIELEAAISRFSGGLSWVVKKPLILPTPQYPEEKFKAYMHADPLSLDHLIDECWHACGGNGSSATREELLSALRLMNEVEDEQDAAIKAATQRADAAERVLGEVMGLLREEIRPCLDVWANYEPVNTSGALILRIDALLSATAQYAEVKS